ncbi:DUF87 domain-containing protein [Rhodopseudomonas palustris]|uniref:helicase HerA domain-containing protein n=1 Tax=Rhodopseudomonas palustris TaxID=1076 RepID=UPI0022F0DCD8|nr:DUF87 domain-containing protein [Rhodopseudomonas palustris]WBU27512.1 DUF87 domain-containing protein [Rhodopseudomonas palustris]
MKPAIPPQVLTQHIAFLGKTGSGKTSTAKLAVEQIVREDAEARVCVLDTVKSDWWGLTSSADGRHPGLPFYILGGPRGHVPLHDSAGKAIAELVATGALPLSIIDMADFAPGGVQKFFNEFAPVLLRKMRGVLHLVIEEAHEIAPKERAGFSAENMAIHWAKKLATAGRSKGLRIMVLTQRTQALHNAVLGSCDTIIAHRLTAPADQTPVKSWLKANVSKDVFENVSSSLASLKTGSGWVCSGEAQVAELFQFPKITTFDNSATPTGNDGHRDIKTAPVDADKLRAIIGDAVKEAEANDPDKLRAQIAALTAAKASLESKVHAAVQAAPDTAAIAAAERRGFERGQAMGLKAGFGRAMVAVQSAIAGVEEDTDEIPYSIISSASTPASATAVGTTKRATAAMSDAHPPSPVVGGKSEQKIINAIRWWVVMGVSAPSQAQVAFIAGYSHKSGTWATYLSRLRSAGLIDGRGALTLTTAGEVAAGDPDAPPTAADLRAAVLDKIDSPLQRILRPILDVYPESLTQKQAANAAGYSHSSGTWATYLSRLRSLDLIEGRGDLKAQGWLFP